MATNTSDSTQAYDDLVQLNDQRAVTLSPVIVILGFYMILGLVGNSLVCYIMGFRLQSSNQSFLIVSLAIFDLLSCLLAIPQDIVEMRFSLIFPSDILCKIFSFITCFSFVASVFTLILIAIDRYKKICKPLNHQISRHQMKKAMAACVIAALFLSWPAAIVYGLRFYKLPIKDQMAHECSISDNVKDTVFPIIFPAILFLVFIISCGVLTTLYSIIMVRIKQRNRRMKRKEETVVNGRKEASNLNTDSSKTLAGADEGKDCGGLKIGQTASDLQPQESHSVSSSVSSEVSSQSTACVSSNNQAGNPDQSKDFGFTAQINENNPTMKKTGWAKARNKTNVIAFLVTLIFILSFLPFLSLEIARVFSDGFHETLKGAPLVLHHIFYRSYYINAVSNPLIYGALNTQFRLEAKILFCKFFCLK